ncbi:MAG: amidohydrolase family protein [bacterium]|nr:amidohydrolase [Deltaproteobacteria bacterium]MCP4906485.1 amidohydrolase family protein [bacterium]
MAADIVIRGGDVVDGSGAPRRRADVAIKDGRISEIGENLAGARTLDATGQIVAPGFIDIHTHFDAQVFWDPALTPSCFHGVTTVIAGNCGFSIAPTRPEHREVIAKTLENVEDMDVASLAEGIPWDFETFPEYLDSVERRGTMLNYTGYVGHTALRLFVMGDAAYERGATEQEIQAMCQTLEEGMQAGAAGFATSLAPTHIGMNGKPIPSRWADINEIEALSRTVGRFGKGVVGFTPGDIVPLERIYDLQLEVGRPFTWTALLSFPGGLHESSTKTHTEGRARGADVWPQVSPRPLVIQFLMSDPFLFGAAQPFADLIGRSRKDRKACYADSEWRKNALVELETIAIKPRWDAMRIDESDNPSLIGRMIGELSRERGESPLDTLCAISLEEDLGVRVTQPVANDDEEVVGELLNLEGAALGLSDAGAHVGQLCDAPQATDLLGNWVRDREIMSLERAIQKLSGEPASIFDLEDRGTLTEGNHADVVVFDPDTVAPGPVKRVWDFPAGADRLTADSPEGVTHVLVNGTPIREEGVAKLDDAEANRAGMIAALR